jgi:O-antigen/teichoic acid export membrane protein
MTSERKESADETGRQSSLANLFSAWQNFSLLRTATGNLGLRIAGGGLAFVNGILLARLLGPHELGTYTLVLTAVTLAATIAALGLPFLVTREVASYEAREEWGLLKGMISTSYLAVAVVAVAAAGIFIGLIATGVVAAEWPTPLLIAGALIAPLIALNLLRSSILRGLHWVILADLPDLLMRPLVLFVLLGAAYFSLDRAHASLAMYLQLVAISCAFLVGSWFLLGKVPSRAAGAKPERHLGRWAREAQPFFWITIVSLLEGQVAIYALGSLAGPGHVGMYQAAFQLVSLVSMGLVAVNMPLQPKLAAAWATGDRSKAQDLINEAAKLSAVIGLASAVLLIPFAGIVPYLYGIQFQPSVEILRILVIGQLFNALAGPCGLVLASTGHQRTALYAVVAALGVNVLGNLVLVPLYAANGAAVAVTMSLLTWNVIMVWRVSRLTRLHTSIFQMFLPGART